MPCFGQCNAGSQAPLAAVRAMKREGFEAAVVGAGRYSGEVYLMLEISAFILRLRTEVSLPGSP